MSEQSATYSGDQVSVVFGGVIIDGYGEDVFCSIEHSTDRFTSKAGANGHVVRSKSNDFRAKVKVRLMSSSATNDLLQAIASADRLSNSGVNQLTVRDRNGRSLHFGEHAWITAVPPVEYGREATEREWTFEVANLQDNVGGL